MIFSVKEIGRLISRPDLITEHFIKSHSTPTAITDKGQIIIYPNLDIVIKCRECDLIEWLDFEFCIYSNLYKASSKAYHFNKTDIDKIMGAL